MGKQNLKEEMLNKALDLFAEIGFKKTSVNKIVHGLGVSKGAFYHYFESKDELIRELVKRYVDSVVQFPQDIVEHPSMDAIEKINQLIHAFIAYKSERSEMRARYKKLASVSDNLELREMIYNDVIQRSIAPYVQIFEQGVREGVFDVHYPEYTARVWLTSVMKFNADVTKALESGEPIEKLDSELAFMEELLERLIGVEKGAVKYKEIYKDYVHKMGGKLQ